MECMWKERSNRSCQDYSADCIGLEIAHYEVELGDLDSAGETIESRACVVVTMIASIDESIRIESESRLLRVRCRSEKVYSWMWLAPVFDTSRKVEKSFSLHEIEFPEILQDSAVPEPWLGSVLISITVATISFMISILSGVGPLKSFSIYSGFGTLTFLACTVGKFVKRNK